jgi:hypothetical protein
VRESGIDLGKDFEPIILKSKTNQRYIDDILDIPFILYSGAVGDGRLNRAKEIHDFMHREGMGCLE